MTSTCTQIDRIILSYSPTQSRTGHRNNLKKPRHITSIHSHSVICQTRRSGRLYQKGPLVCGVQTTNTCPMRVRNTEHGVRRCTLPKLKLKLKLKHPKNIIFWFSLLDSWFSWDSAHGLPYLITQYSIWRNYTNRPDLPEIRAHSIGPVTALRS